MIFSSDVSMFPCKSDCISLFYFSTPNKTLVNLSSVSSKFENNEYYFNYKLFFKGCL